MHVLVIGSGIFGVTAALELRARGCDVTLVDPGPIPHPLAESTDVSKIVRCDYAGDEDYTILGERALDGWRRWNATWRTPRFHETGVMFLTHAAMPPGGFDLESFTLLSRRGHRVERLDAAAIAARFPAYRPGAFTDGYFHREGGWAESGATVAQLAADAALAGVEMIADVAIARLAERGAITAAGDHLDADHVIVAAGAWTPVLVPALADRALRATGQPVFHLRPADPSLFAAARFPVFGADISRTGYYGFPITRDGIVKIANHGTGLPLAPDAPAELRQVTAAQETALRAFVADTFPALADAPIVYRRLCVYGDSRDGHFWIARHPECPDVTVAAGGSGHGFKFAPVLGELIADVALGRPNRFADKFRWRALDGDLRADAARST
ncbi:MAG TPA: FAD-dependent oxidoreductase [Kofleriaceae bacterium]|nr:FAD-dependent oxidoreductase [Kofleriaceae bacterium]